MDVKSEMPASVWKVVVQKGQQVEAGEPVVILESMKTEVPVEAPTPGTVKEVRVREGDLVRDGQVLVVLEPR